MVAPSFLLEWGIYPKSTVLAYRALLYGNTFTLNIIIPHLPSYIFGLISLSSHVFFSSFQEESTRRKTN